MLEYPWYKIVDKSAPLMQGDIIESCPIIIPSTNPNKEDINISAEVEKYDIIVLTQSCDLEFKKVELVLVCPVITLSDAEEMYPFFKSTDSKNALREGATPAFHLLNECKMKEIEQDFLIVSFRNVYGVPYELIIKLIKNNQRRLALLPPYREHLAQAFARFFMRVGLPVNIPKFKSKKSKT